MMKEMEKRSSVSLDDWMTSCFSLPSLFASCLCFFLLDTAVQKDRVSFVRDFCCKDRAALKDAPFRMQKNDLVLKKERILEFEKESQQNRNHCFIVCSKCNWTSSITASTKEKSQAVLFGPKIAVFRGLKTQLKCSQTLFFVAF